MILLIGLDGTSYQEAATILYAPERNHPLTRLSRGRESLRTLMGSGDAMGGGERCSYHERRAEAPTPRPGT